MSEPEANALGMEEDNSFERFEPEQKEEEDDNEIMMSLINEANIAQDQATAAAATEPTKHTTVPTPERGFPPIHGSSPTHVYGNVYPPQLQTFLKKKGSNLIVFAFHENAWDATRSNHIAEEIASSIQLLYNDTNVSVAPAKRRVMLERRNDPPYAYFVQDIADEVAEDLLQKGCVASSKIIFSVYPPHWLGPDSVYLGSITGLVATSLVNISEHKKSQLTFDLAEIIYAHKESYDSLMNYILAIAPTPADKNDQDMEYDPDREIHQCLGDDFSIKIIETKSPGGKPAATVSMYLIARSRSDTHRVAIRNALKSAAFETSRFGTGKYLSGFKCHACRAIDHPTGMCPFKDTPLWSEITNPPPTTPANNADATPTQQQSQLQGGNGYRGTRGGIRGGGRGQGSRGRRGRGF